MQEKTKNILTVVLVALIMVCGILGITNPGHKQPFRLFENAEGKVVHNYFIFSVYQQLDGYEVVEKGKYRVYKRYIGIASGFYEISPLKVEHVD